jgi:hypothetical protein
MSPMAIYTLMEQGSPVQHGVQNDSSEMPTRASLLSCSWDIARGHTPFL